MLDKYNMNKFNQHRALFPNPDEGKPEMVLNEDIPDEIEPMNTGGYMTRPGSY
jgi:hypothetical protein